MACELIGAGTSLGAGTATGLGAGLGTGAGITGVLDGDMAEAIAITVANFGRSWSDATADVALDGSVDRIRQDLYP